MIRGGEQSSLSASDRGPKGRDATSVTTIRHTDIATDVITPAGVIHTERHYDEVVHSTASQAAGNVLDQSNAVLMGDAPACDVCGSITVRNGTCYRCHNCGNSMGCS
jgi:hypothetical protein